jgi:hypothetical protein
VTIQVDELEKSLRAAGEEKETLMRELQASKTAAQARAVVRLD